MGGGLRPPADAMSLTRQEGPRSGMRRHLAFHRHQSAAVVIHSTAFHPTLCKAAPHSGGMTDLRVAARMFGHRPGFCGAMILTLAIATGAATAIFSLVNALILRPLPFADPDRLVEVDAIVAGDEGRLSLLEYRDLARDARTFESWGAYYRSQYNVTGGGPPENLTCTISTSTLFGVLGIQPLYGEVWPEREDFTRQYLVVLSHHVWQQRFGGRIDIIGSTITMDGAPYRVTGVLPEGFGYPLRTDVFRATTDYNAPHLRRYSVVARIRASASLTDAQAELDAFAARFAQAYPQTNIGVALRATPIRDAYIGRARPFVWLLAGAVALLVAISFVNVMNLLVSRAIASSGESAVRLALGATRRHLVRQSVVEALLLTAIGGILGIAGARSAVAGLMAMVRVDLPPWFGIGIDGPVLAFTIGFTLLTALAVGLLPALQARTTDIERALRQQTARAVGTHRQQRARQVLLAGQVTLAAVLLVVAGVFASTLRALLRINPGFDASRTITFRVDPPFVRYPDIVTTSEFYRRATEALAGVPGVVAAGANTYLPFSGRDITSTRISVEGRRTGRPDEEPFANVQLVDPGYFSAMQIPLLRGRVFELTDRESATPVAIVSARTARRLWSGQDPVGRRIRLVWNQSGVSSGGGTDLWLTVVGVVADVRFSSVESETNLDVYAPHMQLFAGDSYFVVRTRMDPNGVRAQVRGALDRVDSDQSFFDVETMGDRLKGSIWQHRVASSVLLIFAAIALCLAVIGTYAVTAQAVASQRHEIGVRLALGSSYVSIVRLVFQRWLVPVAAGVLLGMLIGTAAAQLLASAIGVRQSADLLAPAAVPLILASAAMVACYIPVRRTLKRVTLTDALRAE